MCRIKNLSSYLFRESNTEIKEFAAANNITDFKELESLFIQKLFKVLDALPVNKTYVGKCTLGVPKLTDLKAV
jgi:hypothetical protein